MENRNNVLTLESYKKFLELKGTSYGNKNQRSIVMAMIINGKNDIDDELFDEIKQQDKDDFFEFLFLIPKSNLSLILKVFNAFYETGLLKSSKLDDILRHFSDTQSIIFYLSEYEEKKIKLLNENLKIAE